MGSHNRPEMLESSYERATVVPGHGVNDAPQASHQRPQIGSQQRQADAHHALHAAFRHFDRNADGFLDLTEFVDALEVVGHPMTHHQARGFVQRVTGHPRVHVTPEHFGVLFSQLATAARADELRALFCELDSDGDGRISRRELLAVVEQAGLALSSRVIDSLIAEADDHGDGHIHLDAFCRVMHQVI
jgi:Ca2+-binding EF-hand superfamily protein